MGSLLKDAIISTLVNARTFTYTGQRYVIRKASNDEERENDGANLMRCDISDDTLIKYHAMYAKSPERHARVIMHEMIHALLYDAGYQDLYDQEPLVDALANGLFECLTSAK